MVESAGSGGIFDVAVVAGEFALFNRAESADERGRYLRVFDKGLGCGVSMVSMN